jgi:hypothetical protein
MADKIEYTKRSRVVYEPEDPGPPAAWPAPPLELWACPTCRVVYDNWPEAAACEAKGREWETPIAQPGDLVTVGSSPDLGRFGWLDGDRDWAITLPDPRDGDLYRLIYLVVAVRPAAGPVGVTHYNDPYQGHNARYYVITAAMSGDLGYRSGWTSANHYPPLALDPDYYGIDKARQERILKTAVEIEAAAPLSAFGPKRLAEFEAMAAASGGKVDIADLARYDRWKLL